MLTGTTIADALDDLAKLRLYIFPEYPYLYQGEEGKTEAPSFWGAECHSEALSNAGFSGIADDFSAKAENNEDLLLLASEYVQLTIEVKS